MSTYRVIKPTEGEITGKIIDALAKAGVDCGYEIRITLHNHALMKLTDETVASGTHLIMPETVAKQHANSNQVVGVAYDISKRQVISEITKDGEFNDVR